MADHANSHDLSFDVLFSRLLEAQTDRIIAILQEKGIGANEQAIEPPISIKEAAVFLDKEVNTIYSLVQKDLIPYHKKLHKLYFFKSELIKWIREESEEDVTAIEADFLNANKRRKSA